MRKLIMWNMVTIDGFFEGPKAGVIAWCDYVSGEELQRFSTDTLKSAGMLLFGRVTYQVMVSYWPTATGAVADFMNSIPKVVFSTTLHQAEWSNTRLVKANAQAEVAALKQQYGKDLFNVGRAAVSSSLVPLG